MNRYLFFIFPPENKLISITAAVCSDIVSSNSVRRNCRLKKTTELFENAFQRRNLEMPALRFRLNRKYNLKAQLFKSNDMLIIMSQDAHTQAFLPAQIVAFSIFSGIVWKQSMYAFSE